ncbi:hypothetical protein EMPG_14964 [Blastomyces silverae]|uniref:Uncharacterized protein n=1 Tax=Blastomyces silverae TaxID=2060906 RepID=A0A0H1BES8_9EURO|nr:hypothetical protein EMPG_14964 [Blastomyces silverae]
MYGSSRVVAYENRDGRWLLHPAPHHSNAELASKRVPVKGRGMFVDVRARRVCQRYRDNDELFLENALMPGVYLLKVGLWMVVLAKRARSGSPMTSCISNPVAALGSGDLALHGTEGNGLDLDSSEATAYLNVVRLAVPSFPLAIFDTNQHRTARFLNRPISAARVYTPCLSQGFHQSSTRNALKESDRHRENVKEAIQASKKEHNQQRKDGNPRWHESLASVSEADVKADRGEITEAAAEMEQHMRQAKMNGQKPASPGTSTGKGAGMMT